MKSFRLLLIVFLWFSDHPSQELVSAEQQQSISSLRGSSGAGFPGGERNLRPRSDCTLVIVETQYEVSVQGNAVNASTISEPDVVRCALSGEDVKTTGKHFMTVKGLDKKQMRHVQSGITTLNTEATLIEDGDLYLPAGAGLELFGSVPVDRRRLAVTTGTKTILVVRVEATDRSTTATRAELANDIFGIGGDSVNLRSQYLACSNNQLLFEPASDTSKIQNGVVSVKVNMKAASANRFTLENAVEDAAALVVGSLTQWSHVMLCLPDGSRSDGDSW
jgi:hypothetical protein